MKNSFERYEIFFRNEESNVSVGHIFMKGSNNILLSAPHSVTHIRNGLLKTGEFKTGVIVRILNEITKSHAICKTKNLQDDANFDEFSNYKEDIKKIINKENILFLLDFHIASPDRIFDIEIGTNHFENIQNREDIYLKINERLKREYEIIHTDLLFCASFEHTISTFVAKNFKIPTIQLEINFRILEKGEDFEKFILCMTQLIKDLEDIL